MARHHGRHRSVDDYYPPYAEPSDSTGPWHDPHPPRRADRSSEPYRRRPEPSYYDDRRFPRERDEDRYRRRDPPTSRDTRPLQEPREPRGTSEIRSGRRIYNRSPEPPMPSRRGRSEAPARPPVYRPSYDPPEDTFARRGSESFGERAYSGYPMRRGAGLRDQDDDRFLGRGRGRGHSLDRDAVRAPDARYPPRSMDTRRGRYHPGSGAAPATARRDDGDDLHFAPPNRSRTHPAQPLQQPPRGSPPPRGRTRHLSPDPYASGPGAIPTRGTGQPPSRSRSMPAPPPPHASQPQPKDHGVPESKTKSRAQKAASYAAMGAAARVALQAGAQAAYRLRDDPSPWVGEKGVRVATAALGAGIVDGIVGNKHSRMKRGGMRHQAMREAAEFGLRQFVVQPVVKTSVGKPSGSKPSGSKKR